MCIFRLELLFSVKRGRPGIHLSSVPPLVVPMSRLRDHCLRFLSRPSRACLHPSFYNWLYTYTLMLVYSTLWHSQHDITKTKKRTLPAQISSIRINTDRFTSNLFNSETTNPYVINCEQLTTWLQSHQKWIVCNVTNMHEFSSAFFWPSKLAPFLNFRNRFWSSAIIIEDIVRIFHV